MSVLQWWLGALGEALQATILAGLIVRGRVRRCYSFALYVLAVLVCETLITVRPTQFLRWDFWIFKEILHSVLKFAIAFELAARTFRAFPGARSTARGVVFVVVFGSLAAVLAVPTGQVPGFPELASQILSRILNGTIWLFTALAAVILWYRLPVDLFHKAILVGFVPYLLVFTVALNALDAVGWQHQELASYAQGVAYLLLLSYWARAAWRSRGD